MILNVVRLVLAKCAEGLHDYSTSYGVGTPYSYSSIRRSYKSLVTDSRDFIGCNVSILSQLFLG